MHNFQATVTWEGNTGEGTSDYTSYGRGYRVAVTGKADMIGSADAAFRGDPALHNPEELFLIALSACHMLFFLSLCARHGICVRTYKDCVVGELVMWKGGGGKLDTVKLHPKVTIDDPDQTQLACELHDKAHSLCFIANSCNSTIELHPEIYIGSE